MRPENTDILSTHPAHYAIDEIKKKEFFLREESARIRNKIVTGAPCYSLIDRNICLWLFACSLYGVVCPPCCLYQLYDANKVVKHNRGVALAMLPSQNEADAINALISVLDRYNSQQDGKGSNSASVFSAQSQGNIAPAANETIRVIQNTFIKPRGKGNAFLSYYNSSQYCFYS